MEAKAVVWLARSLGVLLVLAGIYFWVSHTIHSYGDRRASAVQKLWDADVIERQRVYAGAMEAERVKRKTHEDELKAAADAANARTAVREAAYADLAGQHRRLLDTKAAITAGLVRALAGSATGGRAAEAAAGVGDVLEACSGELVEMGQDADALADQLAGLQDWAKSAVKLCGE